MHEAACAGDADKFFVYVDEDRVVDTVAKRLEGAITPDFLLSVGPNNAEALTRAKARSGLEAWRKDINERGKDGDVGGWAFVGVEKVGDTQRIEVRSRAESTKLLYLAKVDGDLKLVEFRIASDGASSAGGDGSSSPAFGTVEVRGSIRGDGLPQVSVVKSAVAGPNPNGPSYEAVLKGDPDDAGGADLTDAELSAPLRHASFIGECGAPNDMKVQLHVAIRMGHAVGVTVNTKPTSRAVALCIDRAVRELRWVESERTDFITTNY